MEPTHFDSLTRSERSVLRLLSRERETKEIAVELNLAVSTVETYIKSARRKLGGVPRYVAARALREHEERSRSGGSPASGLPRRTDPADAVGAGGVDDVVRSEDCIREEAVPFRFEIAPLDPRVRGVGSGSPDCRVLLIRLLLVVSVAFVVGALLLVSIPLGESAQRLADLISPRR